MYTYWKGFFWKGVCHSCKKIYFLTVASAKKVPPSIYVVVASYVAAGGIECIEIIQKKGRSKSWHLFCLLGDRFLIQKTSTTMKVKKIYVSVSEVLLKRRHPDSTFSFSLSLFHFNRFLRLISPTTTTTKKKFLLRHNSHLQKAGCGKFRWFRSFSKPFIAVCLTWWQKLSLLEPISYSLVCCVSTN